MWIVNMGPCVGIVHCVIASSRETSGGGGGDREIRSVR